jgi:hypothetical protein
LYVARRITIFLAASIMFCVHSQRQPQQVVKQRLLHSLETCDASFSTQVIYRTVRQRGPAVVLLDTRLKPGLVE